MATVPGKPVAPSSVRPLLNALHVKLGQFDRAWSEGKSTKTILPELRSLRYRIEEALR